jgi:lipopolysaccharide kinase (Kdo/WaaP) family protein
MRGPGELLALRRGPAVGENVAVIEEGGWLSPKRVWIVSQREGWYRSSFGASGLFQPGKSFPDAAVMSDRGGRLVVRFPDAFSVGAHPAPGGPSPPGRDPGIVLKEESYPFPSCLSGLVSPPRTDREFRNLFTLRELGFPAVEPVACGRSGTWVFHRHAFLITREFTGAKSLKAWSREGGLEVDPRAVERALLEFARDVARLHKQGCYIGTLYGKNVLVRPSAGAGAELALCDVPRLRRTRAGRVRFRLAARDLACLEKWASGVYPLRSRWAFLRRYLEELGEGPPPRVWARRIRGQRERMFHRTPAGRASRRIKRAMKRLGLGRWWPF